jgi:hypothetical protein
MTTLKNPSLRPSLLEWFGTFLALVVYYGIVLVGAFFCLLAYPIIRVAIWAYGIAKRRAPLEQK